MADLTYTITGDVNVLVHVLENGDGTLTVSLEVLDDTGSIGDLNAFFFDLADDSLTESILIEGADVTGVALNQDGVVKVDNYTNMNGEVVKDLGKFDGGVQFGTAGIGEDDIRSTSFTMSIEGGSLSLADLNFQDVGVRLTSVGEEGGSRDGSLKLGGTLEDEPTDPSTDPVIEALDDYITVYASETTGDIDAFIFTNDSKDGGAYDGVLHDAAGNPLSEPLVMTDPNSGATLTIYPDGSADFSAEGRFDFLPEGESPPPLVFEYYIEDGVSANVYVTVIGEGGGLGDFGGDLPA